MRSDGKTGGPKETIGFVALGIVSTEAAKSMALKASALASDDPKAVHSLRVSIRRMRSALRIFVETLPSEVREFDQPLHELFEHLGQVRDLDIAVMEWTRGRIQGTAAAAVLARLQADRTNSKLHLAVFLAKSSQLEKLAEVAQTEPLASPLAQVAAHTAAPEFIRNAHRSMRRAAKRLEAESPPEDIHRLRRRIKRLRYAVEFFADDYGKPAEKFIANLKELQDLLGEHQDCLSVSRILRCVPDSSEATRTCLHQAIANTEARAIRLRHKILKAADEFGDSAWKGLRRKMRRVRKCDGSLR